MGPYAPPHSSEPIESTTTNPRELPLWFMRFLFAVSSVMLLGDALTRMRPEWRPAWFGGFAVSFEWLLGLCFFALATSRMHHTKRQ